ncbi:MAG: response regulator [bacterium]
MTRKKILVVEGEKILAMDNARRLRNMGYAVSAVAASGEEAVERAEKTKPDLVLKDFRLKEILGGIPFGSGVLL